MGGPSQTCGGHRQLPRVWTAARGSGYRIGACSVFWGGFSPSKPVLRCNAIEMKSVWSCVFSSGAIRFLTPGWHQGALDVCYEMHYVERMWRYLLEKSRCAARWHID